MSDRLASGGLVSGACAQAKRETVSNKIRTGIRHQPINSSQQFRRFTLSPPHHLPTHTRMHRNSIQTSPRRPSMPPPPTPTARSPPPSTVTSDTAPESPPIPLVAPPPAPPLPSKSPAPASPPT